MKKPLKLALCIMSALLIAIIGSLAYSKHSLKASSFKIEAEIPSPIHAVLLSDLHSAEFGKDNERLLRKIENIKPDAVFLVGDFVDSGNSSLEAAKGLVKKLSAKYPVYFSLGNHEIEYSQKHNTDLKAVFSECGAVVLDKTYSDITLCGAELRIGGMFDYAFATDNLNSTNEAAMPPEVYSFLKDFEDTHRFKIMLAHRPDSFIFGAAADTWSIDLVLSGHTHGGQLVLPIMGGLIGGDQGYFPKYVHGLYAKGKLEILITSGLSGGSLPRFNNPPEIAEIFIAKE